MKRIHLYLSPKRDFDLVNLMMNPALDFRKLAKNVLVNYVRGNVVYIDVPPKTNYTAGTKGYDCIISFRDTEEDVFEFLQNINEGDRGRFIKQVIRFSIKGGLLDYYFDADMAPVKVTPPSTTVLKPERRPKVVSEKKPKAPKPEVIKEPVVEEPVITQSNNDFDLFGELAALGAGPH